MINIKSKIGTKFEVELINSIGEKIGQTYISQLIDVFDNQNITIAAPIHESRLMLITPGTRIRVIFLDDRYGLISFIGIIIQRERSESIISFHVKIDSSFERIQRRSYFRLDCILNVNYYIYEGKPDSDSMEPPEDANPKKAVSRNLSGNGACIITGEGIPKGSYIYLIIWLSKESAVKAAGKVIRCTKIEGIRDTKFEIGTYITKISQKDQDNLIKYIFDQQRLILKNNLS